MNNRTEPNKPVAKPAKPVTPPEVSVPDKGDKSSEQERITAMAKENPETFLEFLGSLLDADE